jgi:hypothetical protein
MSIDPLSDAKIVDSWHRNAAPWTAAANLTHQRVSAYFAAAAGTYRVRAVPAGTAPASRAANVVIDLNNVVLAAGSARTIVTADNNVGGAPLRAFLLADR